MSLNADAFPPLVHDHDDCIRAALDAAGAQCERHGARLTALRRRVLELVWTSHEPIGAYALLDILKSEGHSAAPPTVYRTLDFLIAQGLVHRLERLNAFVGCARPDAPHSAQFLICTACGRIAELNDRTIGAVVKASAESQGFIVTGQTVEVEGLCPDCRQIAPSPIADA
jgi:Fur family zinc uptake transcriptional regulator